MSWLKQDNQAYRWTEQKVTKWEFTVEWSLGDHSGPTPYFLQMRKSHPNRIKWSHHHLRSMTSLWASWPQPSTPTDHAGQTSMEGAWRRKHIGKDKGKKSESDDEGEKRGEGAAKGQDGRWSRWREENDSGWIKAGVPSLQDLMPDDLRWNWCNNNRNKVHNKCNVLK